MKIQVTPVHMKPFSHKTEVPVQMLDGDSPNLASVSSKSADVS